MVFEIIFENSWKKSRFSVIFGWITGLVAFGTSYILFKSVPHLIGFGTIFFSVLVAMPICNKLFSTEEQKEKKYKGFLKEYAHIINFFFYWFIGLFMIFFVLSLINPQFVFSMGHAFGQGSTQGGVGVQNIPYSIEVGQIFHNNLVVLTLAFFLSLAYGAGSFFLIAFNASLFASALAEVTLYSFTPASFWSSFIFIGCMLSVFFLHALPELFAYLAAAIGGGILSTTLSDHNIKMPQLERTLKHVGIITLIAIAILYFAAHIEVRYSKLAFSKAMCITANQYILIITATVIICIVAFEIYRKKFH